MDYTKQLIPQVGTWVRKKGSQEPGIVKKVERGMFPVKLPVEWLQSRKIEWLNPEELKCGFPLGIEVQDVPASRTRIPLGEGVVRETREIGGRDQVLVELPETGDLHWLPFQNLKQIKGVQQRFELGQTGNDDNAERCRMRCLAYAINMWHENTGSLSKLDIDPLPHQIHLVHHILASGNLNWLIADDVGLGKTVEVGMLLSALFRRGSFRRILLVTPAGLVNQWKEELHHKFGMSDFQVYGEDFHVNDPRHWKLYDHVIGSVDRLKSDAHLVNLMQSAPWDVVVFDEAHRLSRIQAGMSFKSSDRFRLAAALRKKTDALLLLTATPHQGKQDKFQSLLELIRPEFKKQIQSLSLNPEILRQMVMRNHKADVTDADGNFIFQGKLTSAIPVTLTEAEKDFDISLQKYLREGYAAGGRKGGAAGRAIGFVMSIYRKLAASSMAAIKAALERRLQRLRTNAISELAEMETIEEADERFLGEWEENFDKSAKQFFEGEDALLVELIGKAAKLLDTDSKIKIFLEELIPQIIKTNSEERVLIFTEYKASQAYIATSLREKYGDDRVHLIHGSMDHAERESSIVGFEDNGKFLISTEAGGEGINLHRKCHIMVNFDLPWNPMRLVQRVGRLYRYGQKEKVVVFNMNVPQSLDGDLLTLLYQRIDQVVRDMSVLGGEFRPGLEAEILGEIAESLDIESVLERATQDNITRTQENIEEAIKRAKEAVEKQRELLEYASGYNPEEKKSELKITFDHVHSFLSGMMENLGIEIDETSHKNKVMRIRIPEELANELALRGRYMRITLDRDLAAHRSDIHMMDLESPLFLYMLEKARSYKFDGRVAKVRGLENTAAIITAMLRWQNDQGKRMRQEYVACLIKEDGSVGTNPEEFVDWLMRPASSGCETGDRKTAQDIIKTAVKSMDNRLAEISNVDMHPKNRQFVTACWVSNR